MANAVAEPLELVPDLVIHALSQENDAVPSDRIRVRPIGDAHDNFDFVRAIGAPVGLEAKRTVCAELRPFKSVPGLPVIAGRTEKRGDWLPGNLRWLAAQALGGPIVAGKNHTGLIDRDETVRNRVDQRACATHLDLGLTGGEHARLSLGLDFDELGLGFGPQRPLALPVGRDPLQSDFDEPHLVARRDRRDVMAVLPSDQPRRLPDPPEQQPFEDTVDHDGGDKDREQDRRYGRGAHPILLVIDDGRIDLYVDIEERRDVLEYEQRRNTDKVGAAILNMPGQGRRISGIAKPGCIDAVDARHLLAEVGRIQRVEDIAVDADQERVDQRRSGNTFHPGPVGDGGMRQFPPLDKPAGSERAGFGFGVEIAFEPEEIAGPGRDEDRRLHQHDGGRDAEGEAPRRLYPATLNRTWQTRFAGSFCKRRI
ncbi:MAG TPA: hypothetical protein VJ790_16695 [Dongiaceae bacterium]|nr:hypothetical protein [Dongiaceae bacterium]